MTKFTLSALAISLAALLVLGCNKSKKEESLPAENQKAKAMLQGIWLDSDENNVTFKIEGDTVYYPDSTSRPVEFRIIQDTMFLYGSSTTKYPIIRQEAHLFEFKNQNGDIVKLVKSDDPNDSLQFSVSQPISINQGRVIKRDTIVGNAENKYHCYVQINPTTYKVYKSSYNDEGLEVENVYYDNIIHVSIFSGANKIYSKDFQKEDFRSLVPENMLKQCILSDIKLTDTDSNGFNYHVQLAIPDSPSSFILELAVSYGGKTTSKQI